MYDDYDLDYTFSNDYNLDEDAYYERYAQLDALELDEEYTRDALDYDALAYRHYAWYNVTHLDAIYYTHAHLTHPIMLTHNKRLVTVTLDVMCYDDLDLRSLNWKELLQLQGDEEVNTNIKEYEVEI